MTERKKKIKIVTQIQSLSNTNTDVLMEDAKQIIASELTRYRDKARKGVTLDLKEARVVQGYLDSLTKLQKEEREQSRAQDLGNLSNEELMLLAQQVFGGSKLPMLKNPDESE
jgi:hypothetical protein